MAQSADAFGDRGVSGTAGVRSGLAVSGDPSQDQPWGDLLQDVVADAPALEGSGPETLDDDVGGGDEVEEDLPSGFGSQVEIDATLVAGVHGPEVLVPTLGLPPISQWVRTIRSLDLDDVGPHVSEQPSAVGAGDQGAQFEYPQAVECSRRDLISGGRGGACVVMVLAFGG